MGISFGVLILQGLEIGTAASGTEAHFKSASGWPSGPASY